MITRISDRLVHVGADDVNLDLFENQYPVPSGMSYNSYVLSGEKVAVLDTVDPRAAEQWRANLDEALSGRTPDYLVVHHMEPDHSSLIGELMERFPGMTIVISAIGARMLPQFFAGESFSGRVKVVSDGETLSLGEGVELQFIMAPMVHWPEVMVSYEAGSGTLFSADAFGTFGAVSKTGALALTSTSSWADEAARYYFNICGKYGIQVKKLLARAAALDIKRVCALHGPMLTGDAIAEAVGLYDKWSSYAPDVDGVMVAYASIHGGTAAAAGYLAEGLEADGVAVKLVDLSRCDVSKAVSDAFRRGVLVIASSSYDAGLFPPMYDFLWHLQIKSWQKRKVAIIENGSWAPTAGRVMSEMVSAMKDITLVGEKITVRSRMNDADRKSLDALRAAIRDTLA